MNGLSLLVALAAVGVDVGWEATSSGKLAYTIRIEAIFINQLGDGSAIESVVDQSDRQLRKFRVAIGPKNPQAERLSAATSNEVEYGWRPNESGGLDYYVQISRERLETLARGIPLECEVHPDVPEIERIYVWVGDGKLPRELSQRARSSAALPRDSGSTTNVTPVSGTDTGPATQPQYGRSAYGAPSGAQVNVSDANRSSGVQSPSLQGNLSNSQSSGTQSLATGSRYGQFTDNTLPVPPLDNSATAEYEKNRDANYNYNYDRNQYIAQQEALARQQAQPPYSAPLYQSAALPGQQQPYTASLAQTTAAPGQQQPYTSPQAQIAALSGQQSQYAQPYTQSVPTTVQQPTTPTAAATNPTMDALAAVLALQQKQLEQTKVSNDATETVEKPKSSKPLVLTSLALIVSIAANLYLGWLAWGFFWRFRGAASDLSRARSSAFPAGSVAGH